MGPLRLPYPFFDRRQFLYQKSCVQKHFAPNFHFYGKKVVARYYWMGKWHIRTVCMSVQEFFSLLKGSWRSGVNFGVYNVFETVDFSSKTTHISFKIFVTLHVVANALKKICVVLTKNRQFQNVVQRSTLLQNWFQSVKNLPRARKILLRHWISVKTVRYVIFPIK